MIYYGKPLKKLNLAQLAMIAGLPQVPSIHNPIVNPVAAKKRRNHVLERLYEERYITKDQYDDAIMQPITEYYHATQSQVHAPYVAEMIRQSLVEYFGQGAYTNGYKVYTTIDSKLQLAANEITENHLLAYDRRHGYRGKIGQFDPQDSHILIMDKLQHYPQINDLQPALILSVDQRSAQALTQHDKTIELPWEGLSWARSELSNDSVGKMPSQASQILHPGDVVYVRFQGEHWNLAQDPEAEAAMVAINPNNGAIKALVGGFDFVKSKFNRATQSERQPGSSFKPFIYAAALNKGYTLSSLINDAPIVIHNPSQPDWRPHNDNLTFGGPTRLREALAHSRNLVSIRILDDIGIDYAIDFATRFGFKKENLPHALSLALGTLTVTPMDLTAAYAIFANGGYKVEPYLIDHITSTHGEILLQARPTQVLKKIDEANSEVIAPRVIPEDLAFLIDSALKSVIQHGTASAAKVLNRQDIAGKTGTTNDKVDAWFAGYNPDLVTTTWVGFDTPKPLHEYAAQLALPMWIDFMRIALADKPEHPLNQPPGVVTVGINPNNGLRARENQLNTITEYFRDTQLPPLDEDSSPSSDSVSNTDDSLF